MPTIKTVSTDSLDQVHELNRLFLLSLQARDAAGLLDTGFPVGAFDLLRSTTAERLGGLAEFPRALFRLAVEESIGDDPEPGCDVMYSARQILELTILFCAWNISRDSVYHARLFFGLGPRAVHTLRMAPVSELPRMALTAIRVDCAFSESEWLWRELLTETRPEARRQLILVALQPSIDKPVQFDQVAE